MFRNTPLVPEDRRGTQIAHVSPTTCPHGVTSTVDMTGEADSGCSAGRDPFVPISRARRESTAAWSLGMRWVRSEALRWKLVRSVLARMSLVSASARAIWNFVCFGMCGRYSRIFLESSKITLTYWFTWITFAIREHKTNHLKTIP